MAGVYRETIQSVLCDEQITEVESFKLAAKEWGKKATKSKATARKALMDLGIIDQNGELTKHYK